jgi:hypothetical protein
MTKMTLLSELMSLSDNRLIESVAGAEKGIRSLKTSIDECRKLLVSGHASNTDEDRLKKAVNMMVDALKILEK